MSYQNPPPAYDDHKSIDSIQEKAIDIKSHFTPASPTSATTAVGSGSGLAQPQTLAWVRNGMRGAKIYVVPPPLAGSPDTREKRKIDDLIPEGATPSYNLNMGCKVITLYALSAVDAQDNKLLLSGDTEGFFNTQSTYYDDESLNRRSVQMYRATGQDGGEADSLLSKRRTFDDFDSHKYKWRTSCCGNQECIRLSDGAVIASFKRSCLSFKHMGLFTLHKSVPEKTLQLLLATCGVCYQLQRRRRNNAILAIAAANAS